MIEKQYLKPDDMRVRIENGVLLYTPIVTVDGSDHAHIFLAGQIPVKPDGTLIGENDMRTQIRATCENVGKGLRHAGAGFDDVVKSTTYVTNLDLYLKHSDERYDFFENNRPPNTLIEISRLAIEKAMIEITVEAIIDPKNLKRYS